MICPLNGRRYTMNKIIITYDLRDPGKDYTSLINKIKMYDYTKICESVWIISTSFDSKEIRNTLLNCIDSNDRLFVAELTGQAAWHNCIDSAEKIKGIL